MGAGGAIYAASGTSISVTNVSFNANSAIGGQGGANIPGNWSNAGGGGGGGLGGAGIDGTDPINGPLGGSGGGSALGSIAGNAPGGAGSAYQGGGGGNSTQAGGNAGYGGGGGGAGYGAQGGIGGFGGGGGGQGGQGNSTYSGGLGGVGGGNGADCRNVWCSGGAGGGGAGFGGAIFTEAGAAISIAGTTSFTNSAATGGSGGAPAYLGTTSAGAGAGADLFLSSNTTLTLTSGTFSGIADDSITSVAAGQGYGAGCAIGPGCGGAIVIGNNGNVTFSGANTYAGGTQVLDGGTLTLGHSNALGSGTLTMGQVFSDHTTLVLAGNGLNISNTMVFHSDPVITVTTGNTNTISGAISGGGDIVLNGGGTLVLSGNNTYSGGTTICGVDCTIPGASSTLRVGVDSVFNTPGDPSSGIVSSAIGTGTLTFDSGILQAGGNFTLANTAQINSIGGTIDANGFTFNYAGAIGDTAGHIGNLTITNSAGGAGVVVLSGNNTYTGGTLVSGGTVQVTNANSVGTGDVTLDNGKFQTDGLTDLTFINNFKVNTTGGTVDNNGTVLTLSGIISNGNGTTGVLQLTDTAGGFGTTVLSGVNTYSGGTKVVGAAVQVTNNNSVGTGTVTLEEALFLAEGVSDLTFANNFKLNTGANGSAIDANGVTLTISGVVSNGNGAGKLSILDSGGGGKVVFLGANTYTGDTTICACATLQLGDATHTSAISGKVFNEGYLDIVNANTSGLTSITNDGGETYFYNSTSASAATITNKFFGATFFLDSSTAGNATIKNEFGGITNFGMPGGTDTSTAGAANIENIGGGTIFAASTNAGTATINNHTGGGTIFVEQSSAQSAKITNSNFGFTLFGTPFGPDTVTAGNAEITNNADGLTSFNALSTAGNAKITTNDGGKTNFFDNSTGGNAQFITNGTGIVDFGGSIGPGSDGRITAGSIAGSGFYYIGGGNTLVTGSNNLSTTVSGVIADFDPCGCGMPGIGSLEKVGTGTMILSGTNTYTGTTTVIGGTLQVDGSTASSSQTTVKANAALTGIGTVGNTTIESGGILLPGSGVAGSSLNVAGNLAFQSGALYLVTLNSTTASFANVTGTADLAGQVGASVLAGSTVKSKYTILTAAGGRNGQFAGVDTLGLPGGLVASLSYDANNAYLNFVLDYAAKYGLNINQTNVASALKNFFNANGGIPAAFTGLTPGGLSQISGETATGTQQATFTAMNLFLGLLTDPFIDGRGGGLGGTAGAVPFAESESMAYAAKKSGAARDAFAKFPTKAEVARNDLLDQRFSLWGSAYGGGANIERRSGCAGIEQRHRARVRLCGRCGFPHHAEYAGRLCALRRRHQFFRQRLWQRPFRHVPGRRVRAAQCRRRLFHRRARLWLAGCHHRSHRDGRGRRAAARAIPGKLLRRAFRSRLSLRHARGCHHALCRGPVHDLLPAVLCRAGAGRPRQFCAQLCGQGRHGVAHRTRRAARQVLCHGDRCCHAARAPCLGA